MANHCCKLEVLYLNFCRKITIVTFWLVCEKLTQLQQLHLVCNEWVNDEVLEIISRACRNLRTLNLVLCVNISDAGLIRIAGLPYLNDLNLGVTNVTDVGVTMLVHKLCHLEKLDLIDAHHVTDLSMVEIAQWCLNLKEIDLKYDTDASILAFYNNVDKRTTVLKLNVFLYGNPIPAALKELKHPLLEIEYV